MIKFYVLFGGDDNTLADVMTVFSDSIEKIRECFPGATRIIRA